MNLEDKKREARIAAQLKYRLSAHGRKNRTEYKRKWALKTMYGITVEQYNAIFSSQNGCCAICQKHQSEFSRPLGVDHNHKTKAIRELLCNHCNAAIGSLKESIELLEKAKAYLAKHNGAN